MMSGENYADTWQKMIEEPENLNLEHSVLTRCGKIRMIFGR